MLRGLADRPLVIWGDGTQTRDFTFVADSAAGIILAGEHEAAVGQTINLGFGAEVTINDLAERVQSVIGRSVLVQHDEGRPGDVLRLYADVTKAQSLIGYRPQITLEEPDAALEVVRGTAGDAGGAARARNRAQLVARPRPRVSRTSPA